jgi:glycosyltransferase involved in cell wall biosynthesis
MVSIILATFNRAQYLRPAIDSAFAQTFADWEMVIADDGSMDETRSLLRSIADPRVRRIWLAHSGNPGRVRNAAIRSSTGRYLAFLDSDDLWAPPKLQRQLEALRARPACKWSYTHCDLIDENGRPIADERLRRQIRPDGWILDLMLRDLRNQMAMASVVAERDLVDEAGGFDEDQRWCEDLDLCLRMAMRSPAAALIEPLCSVRQHGEHFSGNQVAECEYRMKLYRKIEKLVPDPRLRSLCRRRRAEQSVMLARLQAQRGDHRAVWRTIRGAARLSWPYPDWWLGALKAVARGRIPESCLNAYRRRRR